MPDPESEIEGRIRLTCIDQANRSVVRAGLVAPVGALLLVVIFSRGLARPQVFAWFATVTAANLLAALCADTYLRKRSQGGQVGRWLVGPITMGLAGLAWGSLPIFVFPPLSRYDLRALYFIVLCAVSAANAVGAAARRSYFLPFQVALVLPTEVACISAADRQTQLFALTIPAFLFVMVLLHGQVHRLVVSELRLREQNDRATGDLRSLNVQLGEIALRDGLTGSLNRVAFIDALSQVVAKAAKTGDLVGVLFVDLDRFKQVNDSNGHQAGDELLIQVADRIRASLRDGDILARPGGDEFTVLLPGLGNEEESEEAAHRVLDALQSPFVVNERPVVVSASIGVTVSTSANEGPQELLRQADMAQYLAKENGRNRVERFVPARQPISRRRHDQERILREALAEGQIVAYFQPQIDLKGGRIVGATALARWINPDRGVLSAAEFMPLAQESDVAMAIDAAVQRSAISARVALGHAGCADDFRIWCTVSTHWLSSTDPFVALFDELHGQHCSPRGIGVGFTEPVLAAHLETLATEIDQLRHLGVSVSLDGFGVGSSSLGILRSLSADQLRLSRSLLADGLADNRQAAILRAVTALGKELGLVIAADGVETLDQAQALGDADCDRAQGFLWAPAAPLGELQTMLRRTFPVRPEYTDPVLSEAQG